MEKGKQLSDAMAQKRSWLQRRAEQCYQKDSEKPSERAGEAAVIVALLLMTLYFIYNQVLATGFFTSSFGTLEMFLFYLPVPLGIAVSVTRIVTGRRNLGRPLETLNAISLAAAGIWLFIVFPFNFAHIGDLLPNQLQFLVSWIPNYVGRAIMLLAGLGGVVNMFYTPTLYIMVRREFSRHASPVH